MSPCNSPATSMLVVTCHRRRTSQLPIIPTNDVVSEQRYSFSYRLCAPTCTAGASHSCVFADSHWTLSCGHTNRCWPLSAVLWSLETTLMAQGKEPQATCFLPELNFSDLPVWMAKRMTTEGIYIRLYVEDRMDSRREHLDKAPGDMWWKYILSRRLSRRYKSSTMLCSHCAPSKYRLLFTVCKDVASRETWIFKMKLIYCPWQRKKHRWT